TTNRIYYRLKMYDKNGVVTYSKILVFQTRAGKNNEIKILNNPATDKLSFSFQSGIDQHVDIKIFDMQGRVQLKRSFDLYTGTNFINTPFNSIFSTGTYVLEVSTATDLHSVKFVKQ